jgi:HD-GYP domain-containing protein (c-di-GMP phosphodiesterase class II)
VSAAPTSLRLAELIGALSLATDLGLGLPQEHVLRQCRIALALGDAIGASPADRAAAYYVALLAWVGCTADSHEVARAYGDDIALRAGSYGVELDRRQRIGFLLRRAGAGRPGWQRAALAARVVATNGRDLDRSLTTHCQIAAVMAARLGLGPEVCEPLKLMFERWDGTGVLRGLRGEEIPLPVRLVQVSDVAEVHHRARGRHGAIDELCRRAGSQFDPALVEALCDHADDAFGPLDEEPSWSVVLAAEPGGRRLLSGPEIDGALEAIGDFVDLKSPWFTGHSRAVSRLVATAAEEAAMPPAEVADLRRAALVHDLGRIGVPTTIWDKPAPLTDAERERVRLHPYYTDRVLSRAPALARIGSIAAAHHERLDGSGYHRGLTGQSLSPAQRLLAAADAYRAMREARPHRPALEPGAAAVELRREVEAGRLDGDAAERVLQADGHAPASARGRARPAGLTARELEVLELLARGCSAREVARRLVISEKTARNHTERIYLKIGASSRAEATLFAMRHGLVA